MGEVFAGRYELVDPIGRGGIGAVWRAWDHRRRRYVAAKVLQQSDAHTLLRFVREQAVRIDHPHVLAPASWAADDDKVLFTMDLVAGGSLAHLIGDYGPLPPRYVCVLLDQVLAGLAAVHVEGIVHRDIKPANLLLEATGTGRPHLRVSDFGISMRKGEPRLTETNYVVGTPGYFAPEQLLGAEPDFPADLFAAGLVALYLLEGQKPDAKALVEYFAEHGTPGAPQGVPEPLWQVLAGLLQPDPHARFRTATGARKALAAAVELLPPDPVAAADPVEVFDQIGPLPDGFGPQGPTGSAEVRGAGTAGTAGAAGAARGSGSEGDTGAEGLSGDTTGPGVTGDTGDTGDAGGIGDTRDTGASGGMGGAGPTGGTSSAGGTGPTSGAGVSGGAVPVSSAGGTGGTGGPGGTVEVGAPGPGGPSSAMRSATPPPPSMPPVPVAPPLPAYAPPIAPHADDPRASVAVPHDTAASLSDTGSFHLPPPVPTAPSGQPAGHPDTATRSAQQPLAARAPARAHAAARRPGPPLAVAVPVLLLAFLCFAVGVWGLSGS